MANTKQNIAALLRTPKAELVIEERPIPSPGTGELLIHNHVVALNPIDWKRRDWEYNIPSYPQVLGSDIAGIVAAIGPQVSNFKPGNRIIGGADSFVTHNLDRGAYQTYTIVNATAAAPLPERFSLAEGASIHTGSITAGMIFFDSFNLARPAFSDPTPATGKDTILIWGGASAVGWCAIQFARLLGFNVAAAASEKHHDKLRSIGANILVDYHSPTAVDDLVAATEKSGNPIKYAIDCVSLADSVTPVLEVLNKSGGGEKELAIILGWPECLPTANEPIKVHSIRAEQIWTRRQDLCAWLENEALPRWLERGDLVTMPYRVVEGGLWGLENALGELKKGANGEKILVEFK